MEAPTLTGSTRPPLRRGLVVLTSQQAMVLNSQQIGRPAAEG
ncbi:hypothetical protein I5G87_gp85 [Mycobacterium phage Ekdilam]|uniref:Uncharacterized protein n=1 Tax=Mycobacterium phage Ekdilam TaxID=2599862 RepID=A0A5J6TNW6_9CAUD|nr:hypothetical protein I5G87_gp85 [Mycobacterium phage Ekdilam]QFG11509.1 hypothetical protein PBI_EKDILAM_85 [Mycobacterium phage Ekdilam]